MKKPTKTQNILFVSILALGLSIAVYVFLYRHIMSLHIELNKISTELQSVVKIVENKQTTMSLLEDTKEGRKELEKYFVSVNDPTQFLDTIDTVAADAGIEWSSPNVEIVEVDEPDERFPVELQKVTRVLGSVSGEWDNIYHFIALLELFPYVVTVDRATLTYNEDGEFGSWEGLIDIHTNAI